MKKLLLLLVLLVGLVAFALVYQQQQEQTLNTAASMGKKLREFLLPKLDVAALRKFTIKDAKNSVTVSISNDLKQATVAEREGYPASIDKLSTVMSDLREQRIASKVYLGKNSWAKYDLKAPGDGTEGVGTQVELKDAGDKVLATFILGSNTEVSGNANANPMMGSAQRLVRIPEDEETIWQVSNTYFDLEAKPENWIEKAFIDVQKIKNITVTAPKAEDSWGISKHPTAENNFVLADAKEGEELDNIKITAHTLLSAASFNDVHGKSKAAELLKDATKAKIVTEDGFTYDLQVAKQTKDGADKYYLSLNVSADIPKARAPVKDEKEEDKKKADEAFATDKKAKEEKLAKEQKFTGWVYEVSEYSVNNLLKKRSEIVKEKKKEEKPSTPSPAPAGASAAPTPAAPPASAPVSVTTPPISVTTPPVAAPAADAPASPGAKK